MFSRRITLIVLLSVAGVVSAQQDAPEKRAGGESAPSLVDRQEGIARRYSEFESTLQRLRDLMGEDDPDRAALLGKAFSQSRKDLIGLQLKQLINNLRTGEWNDAIKSQDALIDDMAGLLDLLLTEDREREQRERRERIERYLKEVKRLQQDQKELRGQTERLRGDTKDATEARKLAEQQGKLAAAAKRIAKEGRDAGRKQSQDAREAEDRGGEQGKGASGENETPSSEPAQQPPGIQNVEQAQRAMEKAREQLDKLKQQQATKQQDEAIRQLEKAIEDLEEILRQLREEERQQRLEALADRFRKMREMQLIVRDGTVNLDRVPAEKRTRADEQKALALSQREDAIVAEIDQTLFVLREDGTTTAFPEAVEQMRDDVVLVTSLLAKIDTGEFTQSVENDILVVLDEMIESLKQLIQDSKDRQAGQRPGQGNASPNDNQPLVDPLAELRMIRSLMRRVQQRTDRLVQLTTESKLSESEIRDAVRSLAERQSRVFQITHDIVVGKNR